MVLGLFTRKKLKKTREGKIVKILNNFRIDAVCDIGANMGQTHDGLRHAGFSGLITSFEPGPEAHAHLKSIEARDPKWTIAPRMALGDETAKLNLNVSHATDMSSFLPASAELLETLPNTKVASVVETDVRRLDDVYDDFFNDDQNVYLKIDTQGFERQVLNGARQTLTRIKGIQLELSLFPLYEGEETYLGFLKDLHAWGFTPYMLIETNFSQKLSRQLQIDAVFMRQ